jgi:hypothetical protein
VVEAFLKTRAGASSWRRLSFLPLTP